MMTQIPHRCSWLLSVIAVVSLFIRLNLGLMKKYSLLIALILLSKIFLPFNLKAQAQESSPEGFETFAYLDDKNYRLKEYDQITFEYKDSSGQNHQIRNIQVLPTGTITFPRYGELNVKGLTIKEIKAQMKDADDVDIIITSHQRAHAFVIGAVYKPGSYSVKDMHTIYDAIATAGGFNRIANKHKVKVIRQRKDGSRSSFYIDFPREVFKAYDKGIGSDYYLVQENDMIYIPESWIKKTRNFMGDLMKFASLGLVGGAVSAGLN